jgi:hypothetical protein
MLRCPACGCTFDFAPGKDTRIEHHDRTDPRKWSDRWTGFVSFLSFVAFVMPWIKPSNWCPRCPRTMSV